jgi:hypothetical protein
LKEGKEEERKRERAIEPTNTEREKELSKNNKNCL